MVSRALCLYRLFVMGDLPVKERGSALNLRIGQWSPFLETGRYVVWKKENAMVWIWDEAQRRNVADEVRAGKVIVIPESLLYPPPETDIIRFLNCLEGVATQIWRQGILVSERWWEAIPPPDEWNVFLIGHDFAPGLKMPSPMELERTVTPWGRNSGGNPIVNLEPALVSACLAIFFFLFINEGIFILQWQKALKKTETRIADLRREAEPVMHARSMAVEYKLKVENLGRIASSVSQLRLMAAVSEKIPKENIYLKEWHYNHGRLSFIIEGKNLDPSYYVKQYQSISFFSNVTAQRERVRDSLKVELDVSDGRI